MKEIINRLYAEKNLSYEELKLLIECTGEEDTEYLFSMAREVSKKYFGNKIYVRGLIEFTNYCKNDCYYCGIRRSNRNVNRFYNNL